MLAQGRPRFSLHAPRQTGFINAVCDGSARRASTLLIDVRELGPGDEEDATRDATVNLRIIRVSGRIENETVGLALGVEATFPADITTAVRNSLQRGPDGKAELSRFLNGTAHPPALNGAAMQVMNDDRVVVASSGHLKIHVPDRELRLPEGALPISEVGPTVTVIRNRETFQLKCSGSLCP